MIARSKKSQKRFRRKPDINSPEKVLSMYRADRDIDQRVVASALKLAIEQRDIAVAKNSLSPATASKSKRKIEVESPEHVLARYFMGDWMIDQRVLAASLMLVIDQRNAAMAGRPINEVRPDYCRM